MGVYLASEFLPHHMSRSVEDRTESIDDDVLLIQEAKLLLDTNPELYKFLAHVATQVSDGEALLHQRVFRAELLVLRGLTRQLEIAQLEQLVTTSNQADS